MLLVNNLDYVLTKEKKSEIKRYRPDMSAKIDQMMRYLIEQRVVGPGIAEHDKYLKILCTGLKTIIGTQTIARALLVNDPGLVDHSPTWWAAFHTTGSLDTSVKINIAMIAGAHALVIKELKNLPDDWYAINLIYGDPLTNAIKLGNIAMLNTIMDHLTTIKLGKQNLRGYLVLAQTKSAFPLEDSVTTAVMYNRPDMVWAFLEMYRIQFGNPTNSVLE